MEALEQSVAMDPKQLALRRHELRVPWIARVSRLYRDELASRIAAFVLR